MPPTFENVVAKNELRLRDTTINRVQAFGQEIWMKNIRNRTEIQTLHT